MSLWEGENIICILYPSKNNIICILYSTVPKIFFSDLRKTHPFMGGQNRGGVPNPNPNPNLTQNVSLRCRKSGKCKGAKPSMRNFCRWFVIPSCTTPVQPILQVGRKIEWKSYSTNGPKLFYQLYSLLHPLIDSSSMRKIQDIRLDLLSLKSSSIGMKTSHCSSLYCWYQCFFSAHM